MEKKLKRGLAELSRLFISKQALRAIQPVAVSLEIEPPTQVPIASHETQGIPALICASFIRISPRFQTGDFVALLEQTRPVFSETYLFSVTPTGSRYQEFQQLFSLSEREAPVDTLYDVGGGISFGCLGEAEMNELAHPELHVDNGRHVLVPSQKALVVLDSPLAFQPDRPPEPVDASVLDLLDHCVFVVEANLNQLTWAYQLIRFCFARNPMARASLFIVGEKAEEVCDAVYNRFSLMISRFLGFDVGFLGWASDKDMLLNPELLLEEGGNSIQLSSKARLSEMLFPSVSI